MKMPALTVLCILITLFSLTSCRQAGSFFTDLTLFGQEASQSRQTGESENPDITNSSAEDGPDQNNNGNIGGQGASLFDYKAIKIEATKSLDIEIKNCNVYPDIYGDLIIMGEIENSSSVYKTNLEITFDFYDSRGEIIDSQKIKTVTSYLLPEKRFPFSLTYNQKSKYIDISKIKIGVNYRNYNESFEGFPVVTRKNYFYNDDMMIINGNISNIGSSDIEDIKLVGVFYNNKNQVVFIKECYLVKEALLAGQNEDFVLKILLDEYTPQFTHFKFETAFRDTLKV